MRKKFNYLVVVMAGAIILPMAVSAKTLPTNNNRSMRAGAAPSVVGKITSVSGSTITVASSNGKTYTVDASSATLEKITPKTAGSTAKTAPVKITVADIAVGDTISASGTLTGTNLTATRVMDGLMMGKRGSGGGKEKAKHALRNDVGVAQKSETPKITGKFTTMKKTVSGVVQSVNGNSITVLSTDGKVTYTVNDANALILNAKNRRTAVAIQANDKVIVSGTINKNSPTDLTAKSIRDLSTK